MAPGAERLTEAYFFTRDDIVNLRPKDLLYSIPIGLESVHGQLDSFCEPFLQVVVSIRNVNITIMAAQDTS